MATPRLGSTARCGCKQMGGPLVRPLDVLVPLPLAVVAASGGRGRARRSHAVRSLTGVSILSLSLLPLGWLLRSGAQGAQQQDCAQAVSRPHSWRTIIPGIGPSYPRGAGGVGVPMRPSNLFDSRPLPPSGQRQVQQQQQIWAPNGVPRPCPASEGPAGKAGGRGIGAAHNPQQICRLICRPPKGFKVIKLDDT